MATIAEDICSTALLMMGEEEITSLLENTRPAKVASSVYEDTVQEALQQYPWLFSLKQISLGGPLVGQGNLDYKYKYELPNDFLRMIHIYGDYDYKIFGNQLHTNQEDVKIVYQMRVNEDIMPAYFKRLLHYQLASIFSISLSEDLGKADRFKTEAKQQAAKARSIDSQQQPNEGIPDSVFSLLNVRL